MINPESTKEKRAFGLIEYHDIPPAQKDLIERACSKASSIVTKELGAEGIDVIISSNPGMTIEELGVGGFCCGPNHIEVYVNPKHEAVTEENLLATFLHETHHCMRLRSTGFGEYLGADMVFEGLACLFEEEHIGKAPIYATVELNDEHVAKSMRALYSEEYDFPKWFFGNGSLERWFGYTLGYNLCKEYSERTSKSASDLVNLPAKTILESPLVRFKHETL